MFPQPVELGIHSRPLYTAIYLANLLLNDTVYAGVQKLFSRLGLQKSPEAFPPLRRINK